MPIIPFDTSFTREYILPADLTEREKLAREIEFADEAMLAGTDADRWRKLREELIAAFENTPESPIPERPVFTIGTLDVQEQTYLTKLWMHDAADPFALLEAVRLGLKGWNWPNVPFETKERSFDGGRFKRCAPTDATLNCVQPFISELGTQVVYNNRLATGQKKR
jgi:hypothetical protein